MGFMDMEAIIGVGPADFAGSIFLSIAILLGIISVIITFNNARKLRHQVFEVPFIYFALGMLFITFSLIDVTFMESVLSEKSVILLHDLSFILAFAFMLAASIKITNYLSGLESFTENFVNLRKERSEKKKR